ncbi:TPA_asm: coat protein [ssRNA phage Zoerhiza.2_30]|uniref:Coat protein n=2 Tax=Fiersviridae TaxID=2842319 RepID=A0A8S5KYN4_9VIRU|nr:coat protein [ssRNA phage Zoerhiza.2_30]QDH87723.1 MAG: hypothetical protein H2Rhizo33874_000003 [Leviviridae sp.]DAD50424.1 TPA_asm: coat protein [ssRNA phage Zoerhiza.2_30]
MPSMASITVKKADGTTDIVFDQISASGGENSPAFWRQDTGAAAGLPVGLRPYLRLSSKWNGPKTARQIAFEANFPYAVQDSTTTLYSAKDRVVATGVITMPQGIPSVNLNEAAAQILNLLSSALIKSSVQVGYAPT